MTGCQHKVAANDRSCAAVFEHIICVVGFDLANCAPGVRLVVDDHLTTEKSDAVVQETETSELVEMLVFDREDFRLG